MNHKRRLLSMNDLFRIVFLNFGSMDFFGYGIFVSFTLSLFEIIGRLGRLSFVMLSIQCK